MPDCIFCKIARGELPAIKVYEDTNTLAFLSIQPTNTGHTLVIPKEHAANVFEISPNSWTQVMASVHKLAPAIETSMQADGVNIIMNNREHSGQTVHHAHVHLIPRYKGDGLPLWPHKDIVDGDAVGEKIRKALA